MHHVFCIFENSGGESRPSLWRSVSSPVPSPAAPNLPVSLCSLVTIQLSVKRATRMNRSIRFTSSRPGENAPRRFERVAGPSTAPALFSHARRQGAEGPTFVGSVCLADIYIYIYNIIIIYDRDPIALTPKMLGRPGSSRISMSRKRKTRKKAAARERYWPVPATNRCIQRTVLVLFPRGGRE